MSWFHHEESYDIRSNDTIIYGEQTITYGSGSDSGSGSGTPSSSGPWDDYQREREYCACCDQHTR